MAKQYRAQQKVFSRFHDNPASWVTLASSRNLAVTFVGIKWYFTFGDAVVEHDEAVRLEGPELEAEVHAVVYLHHSVFELWSGFSF